ncbi:seven-hairpin glycosidase [Lichtheimia hyalospora FSU 10163]|nr:seven-hairpin glycosidase [Lichtheimia hyalospora FSU 10163]
MIIMGLKDEYNDALDFVKNDLYFNTSIGNAKGFETGIRYLGGLLSAYDLAGDSILLDKAKEVMEDVLLPLFSSPSGAPYTFMDVNSKKPVKTNTINLAEFGTYSLEFTRLSQITKDNSYAKLANTLIENAISNPSVMPGLYPTHWDISGETMKPIKSSIVTVGAGGDSFYEYLPKTFLLTGNSRYMDAWTKAVDSIQKFLLSPTAQDPNIQFVASITNGTVSYTSDELICFWPGNVLLGITQLNQGEQTEAFRSFADTFMKSCIQTWSDTATDIAPEVWSWTPAKVATEGALGQQYDAVGEILKDITLGEKEDHRRNGGPVFKIEGSAYNLRPETIESLFYYYRATGDEYYKETAWKWFENIRNFTMTDSGYTMIHNVDSTKDTRGNFQESFFLAETLKYLYLLFVDNKCISLNNYVFSTEAHPFKLERSIQFQGE